MATTPVQLYVLDAAFTNRAIPAPPFFRSAGGIAQLSGRGLTYFKTAYQVFDPRPASSRNVAWAPETQATYLIDQAVYPDFITTVTSAPAAANAALFGMIDLLAFNYNPNTTAAALEAIIIGSPALAPYYKPGSFSIGPSTAIGAVYFDNGTQTTLTCPTKVNFVINIPNGSQTLSYAITAWVDNNTFLSSYANSTIVAVVPPTNYADLLNLSIQATSSTLATDAYVAGFSQPLVNQALQAGELSGYISYVAKIIDGTASMSMSFNIAYVGQVPTFAAMRAAIRTTVEGSGVGTPALWQARIPELYVESRIYLVPIWDQRITSGSGTLYSGISSPLTQLSKATAALGASQASALVNQYGEFLMAAYDLLPIIAVPDSTSQPADDLASLYPTYQSYAPTDTNFLYMASSAQAFATMLNMALPVAAGATTNAAYPTVIDGSLTYVSFTQGMVEFCILTKAYYAQQLGVST